MIKLILPLKGINSTQKTMLIDVILYEENQFMGKDSYMRLQIDKHTYNKQMRSLIRKGLVRNISKGEYALNLEIF